MEIYRQSTSNNVYFLAAGVTEVEATASFNGGPEVSLTVETNGEVHKAKIPFVQNEGIVLVNWSFEANTFDGDDVVVVTDTYDVVTPVLNDYEIKEIHPEATAPEIINVERAVRHIIQAHTGQRFGRFVGSYTVRGNGMPTLQLPSRLQAVEKVNGVEAGKYFAIDSDGYAMYYFPWGIPPVKADYYGLHQHVGGVIHNPNNVKLGDFSRSQNFVIEGIWGWDEVPPQIKEAARLLVNDYACGDIQYRDRYLQSMTAADWRIQFNSGAFARTGNARADQLLSDYVLKRGWAII